MLPGLRFLFAAVVLAVSLLIFGLGAAALLRAAHQEFASLPNRPAPPEPVFASRSDAAPTLAMLRVDAQTPDEAMPEHPATENAETTVQPETSPSIGATTQPPAGEPDRVDLAASKPETENSAEVAPSEMPAPDGAAATAEVLPASQAPPASEAPSAAEAPSSVETKLAATETVTPPLPANQPAPIDPEPSTAMTPKADAIETKIATLGGPPIEIETPIKVKQRSRESAAAKKRLRAERASERRKLARRARASRRVSRALADPFAAQQFGAFPGVSGNP